MINIAILGATGKVGEEIINVINHFNIDCKLDLFASKRSEGKVLTFNNVEYTVKNAENINYSDYHVTFFAISGGFSTENAQKAVDAGCYVIDNSSAFRYHENVPLIIPEINSRAIKDSKLIANPNCTTAIGIIPLNILHNLYNLKSVMFSTYQATSGAGYAGMEELKSETLNYLNGKEVSNKAFVHPIPFNVIPHIDTFMENDYTREEMKVVWESRKIMGNPDLKVSSTCVRIPTLRAHSESIIAITEKDIDIDEFRSKIEQNEGVILKDDVKNNIYPMPLNASGKYDVEVGRIRHNLIFGKNSVEFFVSGDQLLKGAALNAVQILNVLIKENKIN